MAKKNTGYTEVEVRGTHMFKREDVESAVVRVIKKNIKDIAPVQPKVTCRVATRGGAGSDDISVVECKFVFNKHLTNHEEVLTRKLLKDLGFSYGKNWDGENKIEPQFRRGV